MRVAPEVASLSSSRRLPVSSALAVVTPVMCLPGWASEFAYWTATGSVTVAITVGMARLAYQAASVAALVGVNSTSTLSATSSFACAAITSTLPAATRFSIARFLPSTNPSARSPSTKAFGRLSLNSPLSVHSSQPTRQLSPASGRTR